MSHLITDIMIMDILDKIYYKRYYIFSHFFKNCERYNKEDKNDLRKIFKFLYYRTVNHINSDKKNLKIIRKDVLNFIKFMCNHPCTCLSSTYNALCKIIYGEDWIFEYGIDCVFFIKMYLSSDINHFDNGPGISLKDNHLYHKSICPSCTNNPNINLDCLFI
jgi:hypothetical protein